MRRLLLALGLAGVGLLVAVGLASADGGPHGSYSATADGCAGCHRTHTAQASKLLKTDQSTLCFSCHDGTGSKLDSWDGALLTGTQTTSRPVPQAAVTGALRGGGFAYARIDSASAAAPGVALPNSAAGARVSSAHIRSSVNGLTPSNVIWGNGTGAGTTLTSPLACGDCHNPHGNGNYRILRPIPSRSGASGAGVALTDEAGTARNYSTTNYWNTYRGPTTATFPWTGAQMSNWCSTCHTRYRATSASSSGDAIFNYRHLSDGTDQITAEADSPYGGVSTNVYTTSCLQCHVSHGSNAAQGTDSQAVPMPGASAGRGTNSSLLKIDNRGTCVACHGTTP